MHTLYLDLASHEGLIAAVTDTAITASQSVDHRIDDAELLPAVESALSKAGWSYPDLTHIACVVGPGGFTSLRSAVSLANTLSHELKIPSCGIHLSDLYFARCPSPPTPLPKGEGRVWLHSTKKAELFIRNSDAEARCVPVDDLKSLLKKGDQWMGELIPEHRALVDSLGARPAELRPIEEVLPAFLQSRQWEKGMLQPWYGRGW